MSPQWPLTTKWSPSPLWKTWHEIRTACDCLIDLIFPPVCLLCGQHGDTVQSLGICTSCRNAMREIHAPLCSRCGRPFTASGSNHLCKDCLIGERPFLRARAYGMYEGTLLEAIHLFKYSGNTAVGSILGRIMARKVYDSFDYNDFDVIMPVPLHIKKLRARGFNQALVLARVLARKKGIPLDWKTMKRSVDTSPQVGLGQSERSRNVRGAFAVDDAGRLQGTRVLLIDDVYTTGNTVSACADLLMESGASSVSVLTLARA